MHYLVTGGAGFIGSNLVDLLINIGHSVDIWDSSCTESHEVGNAHFYNIDISCVDDVFQHGCYYDVIFHLAAHSRIQPSFKLPLLTHNVNVNGTVNILELARKFNSKVVYAGSSTACLDVYNNPYAFSKWVGEEYCKLYSNIYGLSTSIARFFNVYGPKHMKTGDYATILGIFENQKLIDQPLTITGDGEQRRDFIHVYDVIKGLIKLSSFDFKADIFNFGSGVNYSINEIAHMFNCSDIKYIPTRSGEDRNTLADISKTCKLLDWIPKYSVENYIKNFLQTSTNIFKGTI